MKKSIPLILVAFLIAMLSACGGGDTATDTPAPAPTPAATPGETPADTPADAPTASEALGSATIAGTISFKGESPTLRPIRMNADPGCAAKHDGPVASEALVLGEGNAMANVIVRVTEGLPARNWTPPATPVTLDQDGCKYSPHVIGLVQGQELKILNSDGLLHNVHALPKENKEFNMAMPATRTEAVKSFTTAEAPFKIKCDVHPWMGAFILVSEHPFFSVTGTDGAFAITGLPAGTFTIEAWHEVLGVQTATVTVSDGASGEANFSFSRG